MVMMIYYADPNCNLIFVTEGNANADKHKEKIFTMRTTNRTFKH